MHRSILMGLWFVGASTAMWCGCAPKNQFDPPPPPTVTVASPLQQSVVVYLEENGRLEAVERAEVRARVEGVLKEIQFEPGDAVEKDQVLYLIEPDEYRVALNAAKAELASAKANVAAAAAALTLSDSRIAAAQVELNRADADFKRIDGLFKQDAVAESTWETSKATFDTASVAFQAAKDAKTKAEADRQQAVAAESKAHAAVERAELDVSYTQVIAPIAGRITKTDVKLGNLVNPGSLLATIVDLENVFANFAVSERDLLELERRRGDRERETDLTQIDAYLRRETDEGFPFAGKLNYADREGIDQSTGTIRVRGLFPNPQRKLLPGFFVRIRVPIARLEDALLIPESTVQRDQGGSYVLGVDEANTVRRKPVTVGPKYGSMVVIDSGVEVDDTLVIEGLQRARPGSKVTPDRQPLVEPAELKQDAEILKSLEESQDSKSASQSEADA